MQRSRKKRAKGYWRLVIGLVLGVILLLIPLGFNLYLKLQQGPVIKQYEHAAKRTPNPDYLAAKAYNRQIVQYQDRFQKELKPSYKKVQANYKVPAGYLDIPAIHLDKMVMYYGTNDWVLNHGVGILDWGSLPIGGKNTSSIITGHSGLANRVYFDNIRYLKTGDVIYVHAYGKKRAYAVTGRKVIDPDSQRAQRTLDVQPGRDRLTLLTCTPLFVNTHRLLIFAKRIPLKQAAKVPTKTRDWFSLEHIWLALVGLFLLILGGWFWWLNRRRKKR